MGNKHVEKQVAVKYLKTKTKKLYILHVYTFMNECLEASLTKYMVKLISD